MRQISVKDIDHYIDNFNAVIVDLRSPMAYARSHIKGAVNIQIDEIEKGTHNLPVEKEIILYCERGGLSSMAVHILEKQGYLASSLVGGMNAMKVIDIEGYGL